MARGDSKPDDGHRDFRGRGLLINVLRVFTSSAWPGYRLRYWLARELPNAGAR
jgi:hypothetical protein